MQVREFTDLYHDTCIFFQNLIVMRKYPPLRRELLGDKDFHDVLRNMNAETFLLFIQNFFPSFEGAWRFKL